MDRRERLERRVRIIDAVNRNAKETELKAILKDLEKDEQL